MMNFFCIPFEFENCKNFGVTKCSWDVTRKWTNHTKAFEYFRPRREVLVSSKCRNGCIKILFIQ